ncbi:DUF6345 domain-containing protein [Frankia sp. AgKG'84/4]|uniref:DUF6345 domain-containing protein n=1 Tax=Frankia sp. AgKG'84/4 TaxID=573490 RepID=UPI00200F929C|nr:DUF6345 domain-containing protein [Frankia sp. AgKG'84/4]MCL9795007.1 DUF6345 domain-containing protein [Frankia sp. AgKG'84/4]
MALVGVEWVRQYNGLAGNLTNTKAQAEGFLNTLSGTAVFNWGDNNAWDKDFEQAGVGSPGDGDDSIWVDNVDFVFFSGHGSPDRFYFGVSLDDSFAKNTEINWGDDELEFIALDACNVLERDGVFDRWRPAFRGLHFMLGFHTTTSDEANRGRALAQYLNAGWTVREAWIRAAQDTESSSTQWAYLRADGVNISTYNDHWHGKGPLAADPDNPTTLWYARGAC